MLCEHEIFWECDPVLITGCTGNKLLYIFRKLMDETENLELYAFDDAFINCLDIPDIWEIWYSSFMKTFLISNLPIHWLQYKALNLINILSTILLSNFQSIASILTEFWPSKNQHVYTVYTLSNSNSMQFMKCKVSELRKRRVKLFSHRLQQSKKNKCSADKNWLWKCELWWNQGHRHQNTWHCIRSPQQKPWETVEILSSSHVPL